MHGLRQFVDRSFVIVLSKNRGPNDKQVATGGTSLTDCLGFDATVDFQQQVWFAFFEASQTVQRNWIEFLAAKPCVDAHDQDHVD